MEKDAFLHNVSSEKTYSLLRFCIILGDKNIHQFIHFHFHQFYHWEGRSFPWPLVVVHSCRLIFKIQTKLTERNL